jgi:predicted RNase H-like HicB family nuclease
LVKQGCTTWGRTRGEAIAYLEELVEGVIKTTVRHGEEISGTVAAPMDDADEIITVEILDTRLPPE